MMKATSHSAALDMWWIVVDELNHRTKRGKAKEITHSLTHPEAHDDIHLEEFFHPLQ